MLTPTCRVLTCRQPIGPERTLCGPHWALLMPTQQRRVFEAWYRARDGQQLHTDLLAYQLLAIKLRVEVALEILAQEEMQARLSIRRAQLRSRHGLHKGRSQ